MDVSEFAFPFARGAGFEQNGMTKQELYSIMIFCTLLREMDIKKMVKSVSKEQKILIVSLSADSKRMAEIFCRNGGD